MLKKIATIFLAFIGPFKRLFIKTNKKIKSFILYYKDYFYRFPKNKKCRNVNFNSKKIIFIHHSFHNKTKSVEFLLDYLKKYYDLEVILHNSWQEESFVDLSFIDNSYLGVIFWQIIPNYKILKNIKNDNIIFFPMYDHSGLFDYNYWHYYKDIKIINFSKTLNDKHVAWKFDSMYIQYFPKPKEFSSGNKNEIFFWQRLTFININTIANLFEKNNLKIHIHKTLDPGQEFKEPLKKYEKKFRITYSDWFETQAEILDLIKQKAIYIAPRKYEGIGMSFLEAMAMGKAIISVDNPTMNEYIQHNRTGYLFNLFRPQKIDLSNIEQVQKNTYEFICHGYEKWENDKHRIIDFIRK
ncbi:glycosyltransferase family 4 protein [Candidatus Poribacteria bacterium]|nr:glycosyltransferase family 4 protein [Candidatus Poribacteria bacterium]